MIDVTMTATLRPSVLERTLKSFCDMMFTDIDRFRLVINIDSIGDNGVSPDDVLGVAKKYFKNVDSYVSDSPSFYKANLRNWTRVKSDIFFNLEDDWMLCRFVDWKKVAFMLKNRPDLYMIRFSKEHLGKKSIKRHRSKFFYDGGQVWSSVGESMFSLNPSMIKTEFVWSMMPLLKDCYPIETQFRFDKVNPNKNARIAMHGRRYGLWGEEDSPALVQDIGTEWRERHCMSKRGGKKKPMCWEKS